MSATPRTATRRSPWAGRAAELGRRLAAATDDQAAAVKGVIFVLIAVLN